jgi:alpha-mannosidase
MDWDDRQQPPRAYVSGPAKVRIVENGAARVALEIAREAEGSTFVQTARLAAGDAGNRIEIANAIDWRTSSTSLKATFPLTASNRHATYNWGVGTVERGNNDPKKYEVLSHEWIDLTDASGKFGTTILTGGKYGSDKPDDHTIRLT